eukprot:TRINITY_DN1333_c0_g1_i4.p1 TRINITY_DN1333_c0_g1~~TRINITY_DN1333_c0_g1_i4.p1  ORF type:complete len:478 (-),score=66.50 TRINITY_DN1333_c0_g1_i4:47-1405(-)
MAKLVGGVFRKQLPPPAIQLAAPEGRSIFKEALADGTAETFFPLVEQFRTQDEPAFCGPATLVMVLNALGVDPGVLWKGPWRWYHELTLDCCKSPEEMAKEGIDWEEWICLARCQGLSVDGLRADTAKASLEDFESRCAKICADPGARALVIAYSRKAVGQSGDGHYSPIGAYHKGRSLALVLDTARFKYPPHWLPVADLWEAMCWKDQSTSRSRGYVTFSRGDAMAPSAFSFLRLTWRVWKAVAAWTADELPTLLAMPSLSEKQHNSFSSGEDSTATSVATISTELWTFARNVPASLASLVGITGVAWTSVSQATDVDRCDSASAAHCVVRGLHRTCVFDTLAALVRDRPDQALPASLEALTLTVLLLGRLGLLESSLPKSREAKLWGSPVPAVGGEGDVEAQKALEDELEFMLRTAKEIIRTCTDAGSCCILNTSPEVNEDGCAKRAKHT